MTKSRILSVRLLAGFLFAPLVSATLQMTLLGTPTAALILIFTYPFTWGLGVPGFFIARHMNWLSFKATLLGSVVLGFAAIIITIQLSGGFAGGFSIETIIAGSLFITLHSVVIGATFWVITLRRS
ncbi:hypothetical protein [Agrobacterium fabrum]|uniref:hypothetical protein n=1 Tax=Agrobacterium fabrum TaxID=1176649 RepID=UPI003BA16BCA